MKTTKNKRQRSQQMRASSDGQGRAAFMLPSPAHLTFPNMFRDYALAMKKKSCYCANCTIAG